MLDFFPCVSLHPPLNLLCPFIPKLQMLPDLPERLHHPVLPSAGTKPQGLSAVCYLTPVFSLLVDYLAPFGLSL